MATIENRSRFTVSVKNRAELYRKFPIHRAPQAKQYATELTKQGYKPVLSQKENALFIKITSGQATRARILCSLNRALTP